MDLDLRVLFKHLPGLFAVVRAEENFTVVEASDDFLRTVLASREEFVGKSLFEVFRRFGAQPDSSATETNLRQSFQRVIETRAVDAMPEQRYDLPTAPGGRSEERHWGSVNSPVLDDAGKVAFIVHAVEDVTMKVMARRTEREMRASDILESITEGFFALDRQWRFGYMNTEGKRILGRDDLVGEVIWEAYPGLIGSPFEPEYRRAMDEGHQGTFTAYFPDHACWYRVTFYPAPHGISVYFRDVTPEKQAEEEREALVAQSERQRSIYETALSNTPDLVYIFDLDHRFAYANEALLTMWGKTREESIGKTCLELGYEPWHAAMHNREIDEVVATRKSIRGEVPFTGTAGKRVYDYIMVPVFGPDNDVVAVAGTTRDVTDRQRVEQSMREQAERLRDADRAKDDFLATLSHELRNPLAPLRNSLSLLRMTGSAKVDSTRVQSMMERQVNHLVRLVDDLLEMSRLTRGEFELRKEIVNLADVVRNALETAEPALRAARHQLEIELPADPLLLNGDPVRLTQVISNLIDNAAKYTDEGGLISVKAGLVDGEVQIAVRDNGAGMEPDELPRMFEMFSRGDRVRLRRQGGLGIGLALSRRLTQMHGGHLEGHSEGPGKGSEFVVHLPIAGEKAVV